ncbi:hypothetical protein JW921_05950 [Candidatus Fermentibacterales bacterium]|nr:hypothetical protein [Candidatus Fermentibacterales bacterium]
MADYDGFTNWGTWNLTNIIWGDAEEELRELLAGVKGPSDAWMGSFRRPWAEGAEAVRERIEELASCEPDDGPLRTTLLREGTDHIDWDGLALYWRERGL